MRKIRLDFSASVAKQLVVSLASTNWADACANVTARRWGATLGPLEELNESWKAGALRGDRFDVESNLWVLARRLVPLRVIKSKLDGYIA